MTGMNEQVYDDISLERTIDARFGIDLEVDSVIARKIPVSRTADATLFLTKKKQFYLFISSQSPLVLGDVKRIVSHVGVIAEHYLPPVNRPDYFDEVGKAKFLDVFPGRTNISDQDIAFYRTLVPYSPALILLSGVKDGIINQFDSDSSGSWRQSTKFTYRRIRTS